MPWSAVTARVMSGLQVRPQVLPGYTLGSVDIRLLLAGAAHWKSGWRWWQRARLTGVHCPGLCPAGT